MYGTAVFVASGAATRAPTWAVFSFISFSACVSSLFSIESCSLAKPVNEKLTIQEGRLAQNPSCGHALSNFDVRALHSLLRPPSGFLCLCDCCCRCSAAHRCRPPPGSRSAASQSPPALHRRTKAASPVSSAGAQHTAAGSRQHRRRRRRRRPTQT